MRKCRSARADYMRGLFAAIYLVYADTIRYAAAYEQEIPFNYNAEPDEFPDDNNVDEEELDENIWNA